MSYMSFFAKFRRAKRHELVHPVFGRIVYQGNNTWELGRAMFAPVGHDVELIIEAGPEGPDEAHLRFWEDLSGRWPSLKKAWEPLLRSKLVNWIETPEHGDIWERITVETLMVFPGSSRAMGGYVLV